MSKGRVLTIDDLKGMTVLATDTGEKLGTVADALIHPVKGDVLGLTVQGAEGTERTFIAGDFIIGPDAVMAGRESRSGEESERALRDGISALKEILGANLITENGKMLGQVREIYIGYDTGEVIYRVAGSTLQKFFGRGFYIPGNLPHAYAANQPRLMVAADTEERFAKDSVDAVLAESTKRDASGTEGSRADVLNADASKGDASTNEP